LSWQAQEVPRSCCLKLIGFAGEDWHDALHVW
jgi:hypothetical protein